MYEETGVESDERTDFNVILINTRNCLVIQRRAHRLQCHSDQHKELSSDTATGSNTVFNVILINTRTV